MTTRPLRLAPREEERAVWCNECGLVRSGFNPMREVETCYRCEARPSINWPRELGFCALLLGLFLACLYVAGTYEAVSPQESSYPAPVEGR